MNVFVLCTGRTGSFTFTKACSHITNYSVGHESRSHIIGHDHFNYPNNHIEADNRLAWFLGQLENMFGDNAFYVHLIREKSSTIESLKLKLFDSNRIDWYWNGIIMEPPSYYNLDPYEVCEDYYNTINMNIDLFLRDKNHKMKFMLENAKEDFSKFWELIDAEGYLGWTCLVNLNQ